MLCQLLRAPGHQQLYKFCSQEQCKVVRDGDRDRDLPLLALLILKEVLESKKLKKTFLENYLITLKEFISSNFTELKA